MFEQERKQKIVQYVDKYKRASVQELCQAFLVSESTIRRDLKDLEQARLLKRTHGGAISRQGVHYELTLSDREGQFIAEKERIAARASEWIEEGSTLLLDAGTTVFHLAKELKKFSHLRVITNSLLVLNELKESRNIELTLTGGMFRPETQAFVGPMAEQCLDMIRVDMAFLGANGLDLEEGFTTPNLLEAAMKRKMLKIAKQVIVLADHSKVGKVSYSKVAGLTDMDSFILDTGVPEEFVSVLNQRGVQVTLA